MTTYALNQSIPSSLDDMPGGSSGFLNTINSASEPFTKVSIENHADQRWLLERLIGDSQAYPDGRSGGRNWVRYTSYVYDGFGACAYLGGFLGYPQQAMFCFKVRNGMDGVNDFWTRLTTGGREGSDGIVQSSSQIYPNANRRYVSEGADSHLGETASDKVRDNLRNGLQTYFGATPHP